MKSPLGVKISTPTHPILYGLGSYQVEEESLYVQLGGFLKSRRFFSYIDSPSSRMDLDKDGRLLSLEVAVPKRKWQVVDPLPQPVVVEPADIRWLGFRRLIAEPALLTDSAHASLLIKFSDEPPVRNYYLAHSVILQVGGDERVVRILITEVVDDFAGIAIAEFRRQQDGKSLAGSSVYNQNASFATP